MSEEPGKKKLTLTVDERVIEKAKSLGFNLSEVTESVLRSFSFQPSEADTEEEYQKYSELFHSMIPLLKQFGTAVEIGHAPHEPETIEGKEYRFPDWVFLLGSDGKIYVEDWEDPFGDIHDVDLWQFYHPRQILTNFVSALSDAQERRKEKLGEIEMAKRIVEAMTQGIKKLPPMKEGKKI